MTVPISPSTPSASFEAALAELERLVEELESGGLSLDESLNRYEQGVARLAECRRILAEAESRISILRAGSDGRLIEEPFDPRTARTVGSISPGSISPGPTVPPPPGSK